MKNLNSYSDVACTAASIKLSQAISDLWEAGASQEDLERELDSAIDNATEISVTVVISVDD